MAASERPSERKQSRLMSTEEDQQQQQQQMDVQQQQQEEEIQEPSTKKVKIDESAAQQEYKPMIKMLDDSEIDYDNATQVNEQYYRCLEELHASKIPLQEMNDEWQEKYFKLKKQSNAIREGTNKYMKSLEGLPGFNPETRDQVKKTFETLSPAQQNAMYAMVCASRYDSEKTKGDMVNLKRRLEEKESAFNTLQSNQQQAAKKLLANPTTAVTPAKAATQALQQGAGAKQGTGELRSLLDNHGPKTTQPLHNKYFSEVIDKPSEYRRDRMLQSEEANRCYKEEFQARLSRHMAGIFSS
jgi:hypothetical protein